MNQTNKTNKTNKISKEKLFDQVLVDLKRQHLTLQNSAREAKEAATNEESIAEDKYDTRGLEASYLAGAQAKRAVELEETIKMISDLKKMSLNASPEVISGSLVKIEIDAEKERLFFVLPKVGGIQLAESDQKISVITPESPIGENLVGLKVGDFFEFKLQGSLCEIEIIGIF